jgi:hypothetical protein
VSRSISIVSGFLPSETRCESADMRASLLIMILKW